MSAFIDNERFRKLLRSYPLGAIEFLYELYYESLLKIARSLTHDRAASEDIVQETFVHVWINSRDLAEFHERSIEHYLVKVVRNKSVSWYKKRKHISLDNGMVNGKHYTALEQTIETQIINGEIAGEIRHLISTFPKRERECLLMRVDEEMTVDQIAVRLGVSRKAVERSLTSANKRLRGWSSRI